MASMIYHRFLFRYLELVLLRRQTLGKTALQVATKLRGRPFLKFEGRVVSFEQFNADSNLRAHVFHTASIRKGDVVALLMENRPEYLSSVTALAKLGAVTAAINTNLQSESLVHCIRNSNAKKILVGAECFSSIRDILPQIDLDLSDIYVDTHWEDQDSSSQDFSQTHNLNELVKTSSAKEPPVVALHSDDDLFYIYTSGTTGLPKAAKVTHYRWYTAFLGAGLFSLQLKPTDILFCPLPLYHSNGLLVAFASALGSGSTLALTRRFSASRFWDQIQESKATCFIYIGELLRYLVNQPTRPNEVTHRLQRIIGNGLRPDIWTAFQERFKIPQILEFYGSTEGNIFTINQDNTPGSVGKVLLKSSDNTAIVEYDTETDTHPKGDDGFLKQCAPSQAGELIGKIKKLTPFQGYTSTEASRQKILTDVFEKGDQYFRSGDLLQRDAQGNFYFVDRIGDTFRWKGENVSTQEVQEVLTQMDAIDLVNVVGVQIPTTDGRAGLAAVVLKPSRTFDPKAFYQHVCKRLPNYAQPTFVRICQELEVTGTFKLKKTDLRKEGYDPRKTFDPLFYRDDANACYAPITEGEVLQNIDEGIIRF